MQLARPHSIPGRGGETTALVTYPHYHLFVMLFVQESQALGFFVRTVKVICQIPYDLLSVLALGKSELFE